MIPPRTTVATAFSTLLVLASCAAELAACCREDQQCTPPTSPQLAASPEVTPSPQPRGVPSRVGSTMSQPVASASTAPETPHPHVDPVDEARDRTTALGSTPPPIDLSGLDDAQLAGIVKAIHDAEIEHLQLALNRTSAADVQRFAREGMEAHRTGATLDQVIFGQIKLKPAPSAISQQVVDDWQRDLTALQTVPATDFDRPFVDHQVALETKAITLIDSAIPVARSSPLKGRLQNDRKTSEERLRLAEDLQKALRARGVPPPL
jgi:predicted outer membrane protein